MALRAERAANELRQADASNDVLLSIGSMAFSSASQPSRRATKVCPSDAPEQLTPDHSTELGAKTAARGHRAGDSTSSRGHSRGTQHQRRKCL